MNFMQLLRKIEECVEESDLVMARAYIEENMDLIIRA